MSTEPSTAIVDLTAEPIADDRWVRFTDQVLVAVNVLAVIAGAILISDAAFSGRALLAAFVVLFGAGSGVVQFLRHSDPALRWVLLVSTSVACTIITAELLLVVDALDSTWGAAILTLVSATGLAARLWALATRKEAP